MTATQDHHVVAAPPARGLVDRVAEVVPLVAATAREAEQQRRPLDGVIDALKATGVFRSFVPERFGGYEIDMQTYVDIGVMIAEADPSMGWITTFYMEHNWLLTMFSDELQEEVFGVSAHYLDDELQRVHRDVHMICAHTVFDVDLLAERIGRDLIAQHEQARSVAADR